MGFFQLAKKRGGGTPYVPEVWTLRASSFTQRIVKVTYNGTYWVAGGWNGQLATATDPTGPWTQRTSSFGSSHNDIIYNIAWDGTYWVATGSLGRIATATDPTGTWTQRSNPFWSSYSVRGLVYAGGYWVAAAHGGGEIATATDPTGTWTLRSTTPSINYSQVSYDGTYYMASGQEHSGYCIVTATDPTGTWTPNPYYDTPYPGEWVEEAVYTGSKWVAIVNSYAGSSSPSHIIIATDPTGSWSQHPSPFYQQHGLFYDNVNDVFVMCGNNNSLFTSFDGLNWTRQTTPFAGTISDVYKGTNYWVAGGGYGELATSPTS